MLEWWNLFYGCQLRLTSCNAQGRAVYYFFVEIVMGYWCGCVFSFQEDRNNSLYDRYACKNAVRKCKWVPLKYLFQTAIYHLNKESNITNIINKYSNRCWIKWANIYQVLLFAIYTYTYLYGNTYLNSCLYISYCCCCCVCLIWVAVNWFYHFTFRLQCALHMYIFYFTLCLQYFNLIQTEQTIYQHFHQFFILSTLTFIELTIGFRSIYFIVGKSKTWHRFWIKALTRFCQAFITSWYSERVQ